MLLRSLRSTILSQRDYFSPREVGYCRRLLCWSDYSSDQHDPAAYMAYVQSLGLVGYKTECKFLIRLYRTAGCAITVFQEQYWLRHATRRRPPPQLPLVTSSELVSAYEALEGIERLGFYLLASTGRRSCEINRLIYLPDQSTPTQLLFRLPIQKNNVQNAIILLRPSESELPLLEPYDEICRHFCGPPVHFNWDRIRRRAGLRLHSLRNRFAIRLFLTGMSEEGINERMGWTDCRSLRRYVRVSFDYLRQQETADAVVAMIRSIT